MKILLIGGTGVISTSIMLYALQQGHEVIVLNRGNREKLIPENVTLLRCDIRDVDSLRRITANQHFDAVIDFLSYTPAQLQTTIAVFKEKTFQFVFISSLCAYDRRTLLQTYLSERQQPTGNPLWSYGENKYLCEKLLRSIPGLNYTIIRPYITYGDTRIPYGLTPPYGYHGTIISRIECGKPLPLWDDGKALTTMLHSDDFAVAAVKLLGNQKAFCEDFNLVGSDLLRWQEFLDILADALEIKINNISIPSAFIAEQLPEVRCILLGDRSLDIRVDNSKLKRAVPDFKQRISLTEGLIRTIQYYKSNHFAQGIDYRWDAQMDRLLASYLQKTSSHSSLLPVLHYIDYCKQNRQQDRTIYYYYRYCPQRLEKYTTLLGKRIMRTIGKTAPKYLSILRSKEKSR